MILVDVPEAIADTVLHWRVAMEGDDGSGKFSENINVLRLWGHIYPLARRLDDKLENPLVHFSSFRLTAKPPWTLHINIPASGIDARYLGAVGIEKGKLYILRKGGLQTVGDGWPAISKAQFEEQADQRRLQRASELAEGQGYYVVACVDDHPTKVRQDTLKFVQMCQQIRNHFA